MSKKTAVVQDRVIDRIFNLILGIVVGAGIKTSIGDNQQADTIFFFSTMIALVVVGLISISSGKKK